MKKIALWMVLLSITIAFSSCGPANKDLKKPEFPQMAQEMDLSNAEVTFNLTDTTFEKELPVYRVSNSPLDRSEVDKLLTIFGFVDPTVMTEKDTANRNKTIYTEGKKELSIIDNGNFIFIDHQNYENSAVSMSDEDVKREAQKFLEDNGLLPENFYVGGVGYSTTGTSIDPEPIIYEKTVGFFRKINGYDVYGHSDITVTYNAHGVSEVYSVYNKYVLDRTIECKTIQEAQARILSPDAWLSFDGEKVRSAKNIQIADYRILYYDNASSSVDFIQPCISFEGTIFDGEGRSSSFSAVVPAFKEEQYKG